MRYGAQRSPAIRSHSAWPGSTSNSAPLRPVSRFLQASAGFYGSAANRSSRTLGFAVTEPIGRTVHGFHKETGVNVTRHRWMSLFLALPLAAVISVGNFS